MKALKLCDFKLLKFFNIILLVFIHNLPTAFSYSWMYGKNPTSMQEISALVSPWIKIPHGRVRWLKLGDAKGEDLQTKSKEPINFGLHIELDSQWHTYWQNPGDSGAPPEIYTVLPDNKKTIHKIHYPYPERIEVGPLITYGYSKQLIYFFNKPILDELVRTDLLVCKEECIPGSAEFSSKTPLNPLGLDENFAKFINHKFLINSELHKLPGSNQGKYVQGLAQIEWSFELPENAQIVDLFWFSESMKDLTRPSFIKKQSTDLLSTTKFFSHPNTLGSAPKKSALVVYQVDGKIFSEDIEFKESSPRIFWFFWMAFLGGLILNFMPCVFPIVSIKAFHVLKTSGQALTAIRKQNLVYSLGVVFCFIILGLLLSALRSSGAYLGWGFQLQNPYIVSGLAIVFFVLALSFFDVWSWNWVPKFATRYYAEDSLWTSFLTGLLAVIVASPCTAPFMGAAIGFAITQSTLALLIVFLGLGLGMSLPFLVMAMFPQLSKFLPKPGIWMVYFKKTMGVFLLATVVWLVWIVIQLNQGTLTKDSENWKLMDVDQWSEVSQDLDRARFINFTADWCVTCKVNEKLVFSQKSVQKFVQENEIQMLKVDWTKREDKIARKLAEFGRIGVPLYLFYAKGSRTPVILSELLTPLGFITNLKDQELDFGLKKPLKED